ncbi:MAG: UvrB/UvrC motif-containing protein [Clostridia bacterium]|nr:UvrB/UvrC motif-containing protein [Clostridia bacterium]
MIMCDECGERPANIHLTTIVDGEKKDFNLCSECLARKKELSVDFGAIASRLSKMIRQKQEKADAESETPLPDISCAQCGTTYAAFRASGRMGCAQCYEAFRQPLAEWMQQTQGASRHIGRESGGMTCSVSLRMQIDKLRRMQKKAIANEEYEQAALLRDQIRTLSAEMEATRDE